MPTKYNHPEAFCLMKYRAEDKSEEEILWNSRDGVTPFCLMLRSGKIAVHEDWDKDRCIPDYIPDIGSRVFMDYTPEFAEKQAWELVVKYRNDPDWREVYESDEDYVARYMKSCTDQPGSPCVVEVTSELQSLFLARLNYVVNETEKAGYIVSTPNHFLDDISVGKLAPFIEPTD